MRCQVSFTDVPLQLRGDLLGVLLAAEHTTTPHGAKTDESRLATRSQLVPSESSIERVRCLAPGEACRRENECPGLLNEEARERASEPEK